MGFEQTFKALADPARREILSVLKKGKLSAGEICSHFDMTGAAVSYHLNILKKADLISESKYKNFIYYELNTTVLDEMILWFETLKGENSDEKEHKTHNGSVYDSTDSDSGNSDRNSVPAG
ncbi:MAG: winged helix-turn-helix transcriptional regulator [Oscillospiraceae bacterium]|nr:winged helix-turn-helix transcriptional regulator [Oscillospiraceae bacterium]